MDIKKYDAWRKINESAAKDELIAAFNKNKKEIHSKTIKFISGKTLSEIEEKVSKVSGLSAIVSEENINNLLISGISKNLYNIMNHHANCNENGVQQAYSKMITDIGNNIINHIDDFGWVTKKAIQAAKSINGDRAVNSDIATREAVKIFERKFQYYSGQIRRYSMSLAPNSLRREGKGGGPIRCSANIWGGNHSKLVAQIVGKVLGKIEQI